ncbi:DNA translocase FtsK [Metabacillus niabensis]|uniref:DNA translocase FtsK n=1 Tax=Metabacillus niabensis TaxID=324854 RepID=UPI00399F8BEE
MNWLKKLVNLLTGDEDEFEIEESIESKQNMQQAKADIDVEHYDNYKAEAKIAYQYPKGNFRFPIIPDEKLGVRKEQPRSKRQSTFTTEEITPILKKTEAPTLPTKRTRSRETVRGVDTSDTVQPRRPFQPTAIPSPVYGFQPRQQRERKINQERASANMATRFQKIEADNAGPAKLPSVFEKDLFQLKEMEEQKINHLQSNEQEEQQFTREMEDEFEVSKTLQLEEEKTNEINSGEEREEQQFTREMEDEFEPNETLQLEEERTNEINSGDQEERQFVSDLADEIEISETIQLEEERTNESDSDDQEKVQQFARELEDEIELSKSPQMEEELSNSIVNSNEEEVFLFETDNNQNEIMKGSFPYQAQEEGIKPTSNRLVESKNEHDVTNVKQEDVKIQTEQTTAHLEKRKPAKINSSKPFNVMMLARDKQRMREKQRETSYQFPLLSYLNIPDKEMNEDNSWLNEQKELLDSTLLNFNVRASVVNVTQGPSVTRFEVHPEPGVKVNKITNLSDDIKLSLAAKDIRIEAPIPGKNTIGIEVPNKVSKMVYLREILRSTEFRSNQSPMTAVLGLDISGQPVVTDLKKMPHGLIAGATGSGKSVCINTILVSLLYKATPQEVKLMLIDPKMVELAPYNEIPHLVSPVITDVKAATAALKWAVEEMERRYELFAHTGTREITRYNQLVKEHKQGEHLPYLVIVIDELADLMMVAPNDVEEAIARIAQKARACGIHLIVATQRPSVDVITGLIKANIPTRIAFSVSSQVDSRTIIDVAGAEKLLGKGDMLFLENGSSKAVRLQGTFVSDEEIDRVVKHVRQQAKPNYLFHQEELVKRAAIQSEEDELFIEACEFVVNQGGASTSLLQRHFRIGYNRAARLIDMMEEQGIISENRGSKPRDILITEEELEVIQGE